MEREPPEKQPPTEAEVEAEEAYLERHEHRDAARRTAPRAAIVYEAVRREGEQELARPVAALAWSGLAAGLSMGFSFLAQALLAYYLPDTRWSGVISDLGYSVGFLIVILGRQQLFTENTLTPILVLLRQKSADTSWRVFRLWVVVLVSNTLGAFLFALLIQKTTLFAPDVHVAFDEVSRNAFAVFPLTLLRGIFAGWLIATIIWLLPFAETARVAVIIIITYVISLGHFAHIIAGSVEAFYAALAGNASWGAFFVQFYVPALVGNVIGGVSLVAAINYAQVESLSEHS